MSEFFIPTKQDVLNVEVGSKAPHVFGRLSEVVEVYAKKQDINGKWFVCYYVKYGKHGKISHSLKEDELDRTLALSTHYTSHELDNIETEILKSRYQ